MKRHEGPRHGGEGGGSRRLEAHALVRWEYRLSRSVSGVYFSVPNRTMPSLYKNARCVQYLHTTEQRFMVSLLLVAGAARWHYAPAGDSW